MPENLIDSAVSSDLKSQITDYSVKEQSTDSAGDQKETTWQSTTWTKNYGYYTNIPELKAAIKTKAFWTIGAGVEADEQTLLLIGTIKGNGKDTFNSILSNMIRVMTIDGDAYAEIIRDDEGNLINLKPLAPDSIMLVQNAQGMYIRYKQLSKIKGNAPKKFKPEEIFHLSRDRDADQIHGTSVIPAVKWLIDARNEALTDWRKVLHRNVFPRFFYHLDTDNVKEIAAFKLKNDKATALGENIYIPKGVVVPEIMGVAPNASLNPLTWIAQLNDGFFQVVNTPQIIMGNAKEFTDASGKIVYLSYEQSVKEGQLFMEEQVLSQLNLEIALTFPASLQNEAISDTPTETTTVEEEPIEDAGQPNDTTEELEGKT